MLSLEEVKATLNNPAITDAEALEIRDSLYSLADIILEQMQKDKEKERKQASEHKNY